MLTTWAKEGTEGLWKMAVLMAVWNNTSLKDESEFTLMCSYCVI